MRIGRQRKMLMLVRTGCLRDLLGKKNSSTSHCLWDQWNINSRKSLNTIKRKWFCFIASYLMTTLHSKLYAGIFTMIRISWNTHLWRGCTKLLLKAELKYSLVELHINYNTQKLVLFGGGSVIIWQPLCHGQVMTPDQFLSRLKPIFLLDWLPNQS